MEFTRRNAVDRSHVDDAATTVGLHQFAALDGHEVVTANVHINGLLERAQVGVEHVAELRVGGGVVDQYVETAELLFDLREDVADLLHLANVAGNCRGLTAVSDDGIRDFLAVVDLAARNDDVSALLGQQFGNGLADTTAGAGNESDLAVEVEQLGLGHGLFLSYERPVRPFTAAIY